MSEEVSGFGGWLIALLLSLALGTLLTAAAVFEMASGYSRLAPDLRTLARWQIVLNIAFVGGGIWCLVLAASRSRHFPLAVMVLLGSAVVMSFAVVGISMAVRANGAS